MASDLEFVEFVVEHIENVGLIEFRKMFKSEIPRYKAAGYFFES